MIFTKLGTMAFIKNKDYSLIFYRVQLFLIITFILGIQSYSQFLNSRDNYLVRIIF